MPHKSSPLLQRSLCHVVASKLFARQHPLPTSSDSTHSVWPTTVPAMVSHSRAHLSVPSRRNAWCATTLQDGSVRFSRLRNWIVLNDCSFLSSPLLKQLGDVLHALFLVTLDHDLLVISEVKLTDGRGHRKLARGRVWQHRRTNCL